MFVYFYIFFTFLLNISIKIQSLNTPILTITGAHSSAINSLEYITISSKLVSGG